MIGIDGATFDIISPMMEGGELPNIARLMKGGVSGRLRSVFPPVTLPAWTSFKTGKNPAKHGVFAFLRGIPYISKEVQGISAADVTEKSFWKILSQHGYRVGVVNVPTTYPPESVNGVLISGFDTPSLRSEFTHPRELRHVLVNDFQYELDVTERIAGKEDQFISKSKRRIGKLTNVACFLLRNHEFDFFMINFMAVDHTQHFFFGYRDPNHPLYKPEKSKYGKSIEDIYRFMDDKLGFILSQVEEETDVFIVSDHGFGPELGSVYLNEWLVTEGFLKLKKRKISSGRRDNKVQQLMDWLGPGTTSRFTKRLPKLVKGKISELLSWADDIDWARTLAYSGGYYGKIYINLRGREKEGIVTPGEEYENVIAQLEDRLYRWTDPETGERIVNRIHRKEEIYAGKYFSMAPDLTVIIKDMAYVDWPGFRDGRVFYPPRQGGDHRLNGIFIASGPDIRDAGQGVKDLIIYDIAPTILHLFGVPVPQDMDGRVLKEIFRDGSEPAQREVKYEPVDVERKKVREKIKELRALGKI